MTVRREALHTDCLVAIVVKQRRGIRLARFVFAISKCKLALDSICRNLYARKFGVYRKLKKRSSPLHVLLFHLQVSVCPPRGTTSLLRSSTIPPSLPTTFHFKRVTEDRGVRCTRLCICPRMLNLEITSVIFTLARESA